MRLHKKTLLTLAAAMLTSMAPGAARADVVINEVFYHAPEDLNDLQWIELHNTSAEPANLAGWKLDKGVEYTFAADSIIPAGKYVVVCKSRSRFAEFYSVAVAGEFTKSLKRGGDALELRDAAGKVVDSVTFGDDVPWPRAADGESASLERICPGSAGNLLENWASSSWSGDGKIPGGTPGERNSVFAEVLPPVVGVAARPPNRVRPDEPIRIEATVRDTLALREVSLRYAVIGAGGKGEEVVVPMTAAGAEQKYVADIPGQKDGTVVRLRVHAMNERGAARFYPAENEPQASLSVLVQGAVKPGKIPLVFLINVDDGMFPVLAAQRQPREGADRPQGPPPEMARMMVERQLSSALDLSSLWASLTLGEKEPRELEKLRTAFITLEAERSRLTAATLEAVGRDAAAARDVSGVLTTFKTSVREALKPLLDEAGTSALASWAAPARPEGPGGFGRDPVAILRSVVPLEPAFYRLSTTCDASQFTAVRDIYRQAVRERDGLAQELGRLMAPPPGSDGGDAREDFQGKVEALESGVEKKLRTALRPQQARELAAWRAKQSNGFGAPKPPKELPGKSALVYVDPHTGEPKLFDFVQVTQRSGGFKVRLGKGQQLEGFGVLNFVYGPDPRHQLAEPLAYELHRRVGSPTYLSDYVRVSVESHPLGYHYVFGQPNKQLLGKLGLATDGNLYKALWTGRGLTGQHVKKTNPHTGHDDLLQLVDQLQRTKSDPAAQWELIKQEFAVEPLLNHYAVRLLISDWDGFFNNFYLYHDTGKTKKWYFLPWDEDKTWGGYDGFGGGGGLLVDMPTTFGAEGDRPPGGGDGGGFGAGWWRPGGYISRPVLANPMFRSLYLARVKELLNTEFTDAKLFPLIDQYHDRLREEVEFRASAEGQQPERALEQFEQNIASLKEFVTKRREWVLSRAEIRSAASKEVSTQAR